MWDTSRKLRYEHYKKTRITLWSKSVDDEKVNPMQTYADRKHAWIAFSATACDEFMHDADIMKPVSIRNVRHLIGDLLDLIFVKRF